MRYPDALDPSLVGTYPASAHAGGGYVWDEVLEYRVWCHPERGAPDEADGSDYYYPFASHEEAAGFAATTEGAEQPIALVLQREFIDEPAPGQGETNEPSPTSWHRMRPIIASISFEALLRKRPHRATRVDAFPRSCSGHDPWRGVNLPRCIHRICICRGERSCRCGRREI